MASKLMVLRNFFVGSALVSPWLDWYKWAATAFILAWICDFLYREYKP